MQKLRHTVLSLAGLALAAGTAFSAAPPAGATLAVPTDLPLQPSSGTIVNVHSGKCLQPSPDDPFDNGDLVEQHTCNGTIAQTWQLVPIGIKTFISTQLNGSHFEVSHSAYRMVNASTGLCLDDRDGVVHDGAIVQEWACNPTSSTMWWGGFLDVNGRNLIANVRASSRRVQLMTLEIASGSTADNAPVQLFSVPNPVPDPVAYSAPPAQEWFYNPAS